MAVRGLLPGTVLGGWFVTVLQRHVVINGFHNLLNQYYGMWIIVIEKAPRGWNLECGMWNLECGMRSTCARVSLALPRPSNW